MIMFIDTALLKLEFDFNQVSILGLKIQLKPMEAAKVSHESLYITIFS